MLPIGILTLCCFGYSVNLDLLSLLESPGFGSDSPVELESAKVEAASDLN